MDLEAERITNDVEEAAVEAAWRRPDSIVVQRAGWMQVITPSGPVVAMNSVMRSILSPAEADVAIPSVIADYKARGLPFRWLVTPSSRPEDLAARLLAHGLVAAEEMIAMAAEVSAMQIRPDEAVTVEDLRAETLDDWVAACASGWGMTDAEAIAQMRDDVARQLQHESDRIRYALAWCDGQPAGAGAMRFVRPGGYLIGTSVAPQFRRRGVYRSLVAHRLAILTARGIPRVLTSALADTSAPICARLGFRAGARFKLYKSSI